MISIWISFYLKIFLNYKEPKRSKSVLFRVWWLEKGNRGQGAGNRDQGSGIRDQLPVLATMWTGIPYLHQLHCLHCFLMAQEHGLAANGTFLLRCGMRGFQSRGYYSTYVLFLEVFSSNSFRVIHFVGWVAIVNPAIPLPPFTIQTRSQITVAAVGLSSLLFSPISFHLSCRELACLFQLSIYRDGKFSVCQRFAGFNP